VAKIWEAVLCIDPIGIDDNFFDLGGHSLLAAQITSRISSAFNMDVSVRLIFEKPTVAEYSGYIREYYENINARELIDILEEIDDLSDDDARSILGDRLR
jgi:acyl carrier protein